MHYLRFENANRGEGSINKIFENKSENEPHKHQKYIYKLHVGKGKTMWGHSRRIAICMPMREALEETGVTNTMILNF